MNRRGRPLIAYGHVPTRIKKKGRVDREALREIDLLWHDLRHEAASRWLEQGLRPAYDPTPARPRSITTTQRYLNVTDDEMLRAMQSKLWMSKEGNAEKKAAV